MTFIVITLIIIFSLLLLLAYIVCDSIYEDYKKKPKKKKEKKEPSTIEEEQPITKVNAIEKRQEKIEIESQEPNIELTEELEESLDDSKSKKKQVNKDSTVLLFNNVGVLKMFLYNYHNGELKERLEVDLTGFNIVNGVFDNITGLAEVIHDLVPDMKSLDILLSVKEGFSSIISLPKMNVFNQKKYFDIEMNNDFPGYKEKYKTFVSNYNHKLGTIYFTYFIPNDIINTTKKLAALLNVKINTINLWEEYLYYNISLKVKGDFAVIYIHDNLCTMLNSLNSKLVSYHTFSYNSVDEITSNFYTTLLKHEFELEKQDIKNYILISNKDIDLSSILDKLNKIDCDITFKEYHINGK